MVDIEWVDITIGGKKKGMKFNFIPFFEDYKLFSLYIIYFFI